MSRGTVPVQVGVEQGVAQFVGQGLELGGVVHVGADPHEPGGEAGDPDGAADVVARRSMDAERVSLMELGPEPTDSQNAAGWRTRARTVVAYRERHQITDPWSALGAAAPRGSHRRAHHDTVSAAPAEPAGHTPGPPAPASSHLDPIGR